MYHICIGGLEENGCLRSCSELLGAAQPEQVSATKGRGEGEGEGGGGRGAYHKGPFLLSAPSGRLSGGAVSHVCVWGEGLQLVHQMNSVHFLQFH